MPTFRISLATLLAVIAVLALGLAGIVSASSFWTVAAATVTLALLLSAILGACLLDGDDRAFWAGFALFGWVYLVLVNWDWVGGQFGHDLTAGLGDVAEAVIPEVPVTSTPFGIPMAQPTRQPASNPAQVVAAPSRSPLSANSYAGALAMIRNRQIKIGNFVQIGRMLSSLVFALFGGFIARTIVDRRRSRTGSLRAASSG
jgi:hypothetical protein